MSGSSARDFYDDMAPDYHLLFPDWDMSMVRQARSLDVLVRRHLGPGARRILDCACGIGTQSIGPALAGHRLVGSDLSPVAAARAVTEAAARGVDLPATAADMRALPFASTAFDVVVCADNSLSHLLTAEDVTAALHGMRRVLRDDGLLIITIRAYDEIRRTRPTSAPPQVARTPHGKAITFQLVPTHQRLLPADTHGTTRMPLRGAGGDRRPHGRLDGRGIARSPRVLRKLGIGCRWCASREARVIKPTRMGGPQWLRRHRGPCWRADVSGECRT